MTDESYIHAIIPLLCFCDSFFTRRPLHHHLRRPIARRQERFERRHCEEERRCTCQRELSLFQPLYAHRYKMRRIKNHQYRLTSCQANGQRCSRASFSRSDSPEAKRSAQRCAFGGCQEGKGCTPVSPWPSPAQKRSSVSRPHNGAIKFVSFHGRNGPARASAGINFHSYHTDHKILRFK